MHIELFGAQSRTTTKTMLVLDLYQEKLVSGSKTENIYYQRFLSNGEQRVDPKRKWRKPGSFWEFELGDRSQLVVTTHESQLNQSASTQGNQLSNKDGQAPVIEGAEHEEV